MPSERCRNFGSCDVSTNSKCGVVGGKTYVAVVRKVVADVMMPVHQKLSSDAGNGTAKGVAATTVREDFAFIAVLLNSEGKGDGGRGCDFVIVSVFVV